MKGGWLFIGFLVLVGCVSERANDPMQTEKGRQEARDAYINLGVAYLQQGAPGKAKIPLKKALEIDPKSPEAHVALALVFQREMEFSLAEQHYQEALQTNAHDSRILNNYGGFLYDQKRYPEALLRFQQAAEDPMYSERARVFENLGLTELKLGHRDQARGYFNRTLHLDNQRPDALLELALLAFDDKEFGASRYCYESFLKIVQQPTARSLLLGIHLAKVFQEPATASALAQQLKRLYSTSPEYVSYLSEPK